MRDGLRVALDVLAILLALLVIASSMLRTGA